MKVANHASPGRKKNLKRVNIVEIEVQTPIVREDAETFAVLGFGMILPQVHLRKPCYDFSFL
jgi:hypothetical protein